MESEGSLPHLQMPATCPNPQPDQSSSCLSNPTSWISTIILSSHLRLGLPSGLFPSCFPTKTMYTPLLSLICATCPVHLIILDLITRIIFCEQYRSLRSPLLVYSCTPLIWWSQMPDNEHSSAPGQLSVWIVIWLPACCFHLKESPIEASIPPGWCRQQVPPKRR